MSRHARLASIEGGRDVNTTAFLGKKDKDFQFPDLPCQVEFLGCSGRGQGSEESSEGDVGAVREWIDAHC